MVVPASSSLTRSCFTNFSRTNSIASMTALNFDPAIFEGTKEAVSIITPGPQAEVVELEAAFMLIGPHSHDFGHWIWEYLPKYIAATQSGAVPTVPILIDAGMPVSHRRALELLLPEGGAIFPVAAYQPVLVHHLWFAPGQIYLPVCEERNDRLKWDYYAAPPVRFAPIIREMAQRIDRKFGGDERKFDSDRIFLARQAWRRRKLLNHAAIEAIASARRFRIVYPDELDFETQVRLLRSTRYVVGPNGSALYLTFFCRMRPCSTIFSTGGSSMPIADNRSKTAASTGKGRRVVQTIESRRDWRAYFSSLGERAKRREFLRQVGRTIDGQPITEQQIELDVAAVRTALELNPRDCLLDLCCGNGAITHRLAASCGFTFGVDFSKY